MDRQFVAVLGAVAYVVGWPLWAISKGVSTVGTVVGVGFVATGTVCVVLWIVATGVVMGLREARSAREPEDDRR